MDRVSPKLQGEKHRDMTSALAQVRGLATIALLKVNFDAGQDHIDMFLPFALDAVRSLDEDAFQLGQARAAIAKRFRLTIPDHTLSTILSRAVKQGYCRRSAGHYVRELDRFRNTDLAEQIQSVEREHWLLAKLLREFSADTRAKIASDEDALQVLLTFLNDKHVAMILDEPDEILFRSKSSALTENQTRVTAQFLNTCYQSEPELTKYLQRMVEGFVLQNALLLRDIGSTRGSFKGLSVYFDSLFLLRALGLAGINSKTASRELLELLKATHARLFVFERTVAEMQRILRFYQEKLGTTNGISELRPGAITQHLLLKRYGPADIAQAVGLMETQLRGLGLAIRPFPEHRSHHTLDEDDLTQRLQRPNQQTDERVRHDVDCAAAILTLRQLRESRSLDATNAVFVTTNKPVVDTVTGWYKNQKKSGVPPMVRHLTMSTAAWLKKPAAAGNVKLHELIASCSAALQPSTRQWQAFKGHLEKLQQNGELSSEEMVAVVAHELTETRLFEGDDTEYEHPSTVSEIVESVKKELSTEAEAKRAQADAALIAEQARAERAEDAAAASAEQWRQQELRVITAATDRGNTFYGVVFWAGVVILVASTTVSLSGIFGLVEPMWAWPVGIASLAALIYGGSLKGLAERFGNWVRRRELRRNLGAGDP